MSYAVFDLETTIYTSFKRKANPFDMRNWIVLAGWHTAGTQGIAHKRYTGAHDQHHTWMLPILDNPEVKLIVGQNIKFDVLHMCARDERVYEAWQRFVARGGLVWDCQLAEYLLEGQTQASQMMSLDELAVRYGGDLKVDEVKALWEAGVPTEEIDPDLLLRYLIGENLPGGERREGDIGNTELVFKKQLERARASGQLRSIMLNMGSLCATIEMERNGMYVNKPLGEKLAAELEEKLAAARGRMQEYLPKDLPFKFSWTNRYHLSPLIFGGSVKYEQRQYDLKDGRNTWFSPEDKPGSRALFAYAQKDETHYVLSDGTTTPVTPEEAAFSEEQRLVTYVKYASGKNFGEYKTKKVKGDDYTKPKSRMADRLYEFPGFTTPNEEWASVTPGLYSVAAEIIDILGNRDIPFLKDLKSVTAMQKDLGTYYITVNDKGETVGMLTLVQPDGMIHHKLNHTSTVTARFSSSDPNLQNIPKGNKSDVKTVFESRFGDDGCIIQSDFSSLEVYIQAILTHCQNLIADLKAGIDLHCMRLSLKEHMDYDEVKRLCRGYKDKDGVFHPAVEEWDYKRTGAKVFSFQRAYGAGAKKISDSAGIALEEVEALIAAEEARYPEISEYFAKRADEISASRRPTKLVVPHPKNAAIMCQLGMGEARTPDGKKYTYMESPSMDFMLKRGVLATFTPTEIKNYEVQGEGGEWMKAAMWLAVRAFYARRNFEGKALLVNTVHDAQYADSQKSVRVQVGALLQACMEAASDFMEWWFTWPLPLPVPTDTVYGANMGEENPFASGEDGPEFRSLSSEYRAQLRREYMGDYQPSYLKETA